MTNCFLFQSYNMTAFFMLTMCFCYVAAAVREMTVGESRLGELSTGLWSSIITRALADSRGLHAGIPDRVFASNRTLVGAALRQIFRWVLGNDRPWKKLAMLTLSHVELIQVCNLFPSCELCETFCTSYRIGDKNTAIHPAGQSGYSVFREHCAGIVGVIGACLC